jgi:hypothetical protein
MRRIAPVLTTAPWNDIFVFEMRRIFKDGYFSRAGGRVTRGRSRARLPSWRERHDFVGAPSNEGSNLSEVDRGGVVLERLAHDRREHSLHLERRGQ